MCIHGSWKTAALVALALAAGCKGGTGPIGATGPVGPQGSAGPIGPSGFVTLLDNELNTGTLSGSAISHNCVTPAFTAGSNQRALIWVHFSCSIPGSNAMLIYPSYTTDAGVTFGAASLQYSIQSNTGATANFVEADHVGTLALTAGTTYQFATSGLLNTAGSASSCLCRTFTEIVGQ